MKSFCALITQPHWSTGGHILCSRAFPHNQPVLNAALFVCSRKASLLGGNFLRSSDVECLHMSNLRQSSLQLKTEHSTKSPCHSNLAIKIFHCFSWNKDTCTTLPPQPHYYHYHHHHHNQGPKRRWKGEGGKVGRGKWL